MKTRRSPERHPDADLIERLGGATKLSGRLGFSPESGPQRVHNWKVRGIPRLIRLENPEVFADAAKDGACADGIEGDQVAAAAG